MFVLYIEKKNDSKPFLKSECCDDCFSIHVLTARKLQELEMFEELDNFIKMFD